MIHFIAYNEVFKHLELNEEQKKEALYTLVHGDNTVRDDKVSLNSLFLAGAEKFGGVFDKEVMRISSDDGKSTSMKENLVLKSVLHRQHGVKFVVGDDITEKLIRSSTLKGTNLVESRTIKKNAEVARKNAQKCISYAKQWMKDKSKLPKGKKWNDLYDHVHQQMEKHLKGQGGDSEIGESNKEVVTIDEGSQIQNGLFPGWMVFVLFGPYGPKPRLQIDLLLEDHSALMSDLVAQNVATNAPIKNRGPRKQDGGHQLSFQERAMAAVVAQRHESYKLRTYEFEIGYRQTQVANLLKQQRSHLKFLEMRGFGENDSLDPNYEMFLDYNYAVLKLNEEIDALRKKQTHKCTPDPIVAKLLNSIKAQSCPQYELTLLQQQVTNLVEQQSAHAKRMETMYPKEDDFPPKYFKDLDELLKMEKEIKNLNDQIEELQKHRKHKADCSQDANDLDRKQPAKKLKGTEGKCLSDPIHEAFFFHDDDTDDVNI